MQILIPVTWIPLPHPVPSVFEEALGYDGEARFVAFYWTPVGDEAMFDDGRSGGTGDWMGFLAYVERPSIDASLHVPVAPGSPEYVCINLGSSEFEADWWLVVDREERRAYLAPVAEAREFLAQQWPPAPEYSEEEVEAIFEALQCAVAQMNVEPPDEQEIKAAIRRQEEVMDRLVRELDELERQDEWPN